MVENSVSLQDRMTSFDHCDLVDLYQNGSNAGRGLNKLQPMLHAPPILAIHKEQGSIGRNASWRLWAVVDQDAGNRCRFSIVRCSWGVVDDMRSHLKEVS